MSLGDPTNSWVTRHLRDEVGIQSHEHSPEPHASGCHGGFTAGMTSPDDDDIVLFRERHNLTAIPRPKIASSNVAIGRAATRRPHRVRAISFILTRQAGEVHCKRLWCPKNKKKRSPKAPLGEVCRQLFPGVGFVEVSTNR